MSADATACKVGELMTPDPIVLDATDTVATAARMFEQHDFSGAPVIGTRGEVIGIISKTDLIRHALNGPDERPPRYLFEPMDDEFDGVGVADESPAVLVEDIMTTEPVTGRPSDTIFDVARRMVECHVHRIVIVDESNCPVGIVTSLDLLRAITESPRLLREVADVPGAGRIAALRRRDYAPGQQTAPERPRDDVPERSPVRPYDHSKR